MSSFMELHFTLLLACSVSHVTASILCLHSISSLQVKGTEHFQRSVTRHLRQQMVRAFHRIFKHLFCVCFLTTRLPQHDGAEVSKWLTIPIQARRLATRDQTTARQIAVRSNPPRARRRLLHGLHSSHRTSQDTQIMINIQGR
jgi:hypothetical protein